MWWKQDSTWDLGKRVQTQWCPVFSLCLYKIRMTMSMLFNKISLKSTVNLPTLWEYTFPCIEGALYPGRYFKLN